MVVTTGSFFGAAETLPDEECICDRGTKYLNAGICPLDTRVQDDSDNTYWKESSNETRGTASQGAYIDVDLHDRAAQRFTLREHETRSGTEGGTVALSSKSSQSAPRQRLLRLLLTVIDMIGDAHFSRCPALQVGEQVGKPIAVMTALSQAVHSRAAYEQDFRSANALLMNDAHACQIEGQHRQRCDSNVPSSRDEDRRSTARSLRRACESHGLFFVTGHGLTAARRRKAFENARRFFSLADTVKRRTPAKKGGFTRGYIPFGGESGSHRMECKEAFSYGYPWPEDKPPTNAMQGPNIWPTTEELDMDWREDMVTIFRLMTCVHEAITEGFALCEGLGLEDLPTICREGDTISVLRIFHYFPYDNHGAHTSADHQQTENGAPDHFSPSKEIKPPIEKIGSSPHTDWGLSTTIMQDGAGGLQFLHEGTKRWIDVPCTDEDALVFNCGDYLSLLTDGRLRSPVHRVVSTGVERTSFAFFYYPSFHATLPGGGAHAGTSSSTPGKRGDGKALCDLKCEDNISRSDTERPTSAKRSGVDYNTLLDLPHDADMSFGHYLTKKWGNVFRD